MNFSFPSLGAKLVELSTFAPIVAWITVQFLKNQSAALRHAVWVLGLCAPAMGMLLLLSGLQIQIPLLPMATPAFQLNNPPALANSEARVKGETSIPSTEHIDGKTFLHFPPWRAAQTQINLWLLVWLGGVAVVGGKMGIDQLRISRFVHSHCRKASASDSWRAGRVLESSGVQLSQVIWIGSPRQIPFCFGILKPEIVLPDIQGLSRERLEICLRHEMAHVARKDLLWLFLSHLSCAICWFNPFMWLALNQVKTESELAADDVVIEAGIVPTAYASGLLEMVRLCQGNLTPEFGIGMISDTGGIASRVRRSLDAGIRRRGPSRWQLGGILAVSYLVLGFLLSARLVTGGTPSLTAKELATALADHQYSGSGYHLTINPTYQQYLEKALLLRHQDGAVLIEVNTGDVLALGGDYGEAGLPGSSLDPITTLAAIRAGVFDPGRPLLCAPIQVGDHKYVFPLEQGSSISFNEAFCRSYFTYFVDLGQKVGCQNEIKVARDFGLGQPTGTGLAESPGHVPDADALSPSDLADISFGQGKILVTPLQMANVMATIANGGTLNRLRLVNEVPRQKVREIPLNSPYMRDLKDGMIALIDSGTAMNVHRPDVQIAAKTGTAQVTENDKKRQVVWISGFFPADKPKFAFAVVVRGTTDEILHGGLDAGAVAKALIDAIVGKAPIVGP